MERILSLREMEMCGQDWNRYIKGEDIKVSNKLCEQLTKRICVRTFATDMHNICYRKGACLVN